MTRTGADPAADDGRRDLGARGEDQAASAYRQRGFELVDRNWRCATGELDLVCHDGTTLVFCEVKTRSSARFGAGAEAVSPAKQRRIRRLAVLWLRTHRARAVQIRFDVASVAGEQVSIIEDAF